ncbi:MAG: hypothetical protein JW841_03685 [Deltaproteobacteria bacterium]|nr:hypothetical protein [Deltaproteobacteria bacterium]
MFNYSNRLWLLWMTAGITAILLAFGCNKADPNQHDQLDTKQDPSIDATILHKDTKMAMRAINISYANVIKMLDSLNFESRSIITFSRGGKELQETHFGIVTQDVSGNFYTFSDTGPSQTEIYLIDEDVYIRQDKGHLRKTSRRQTDIEKWPELIWSELRQSLALFSPRLSLSEPKPDAVDGRQAIRYPIALTRPNEQSIDIPISSSNMPVAPTARWRELAKPLSVSGNIWVDTATGIILKSHIEGRLEVADRDVRPTQLLLRFDGAIKKIGKATVRNVPKSINEYQRIPPPHKSLIEFFADDLKQAGPNAYIP